jgi:hypothetical protein
MRAAESVCGRSGRREKRPTERLLLCRASVARFDGYDRCGGPERCTRLRALDFDEPEPEQRQLDAGPGDWDKIIGPVLVCDDENVVVGLE